MNLPVGNIIISGKTLKFNKIKVNKNEFHRSKQAIDLDSVDTGKFKLLYLTNLNIVKKV